MRLDHLPLDIITCIPEYLYSLDDLYSLIRTARIFYDCCSSTNAKLRPSFASRHGQNLFPPHPHLLMAGAARSVADWAIQDKANERALRQAIKRGIDGLHDFCCQEGRMSLVDLRALTTAKYDLLNPITNLVDDTIGPAERERKYAAHGRSLDDDTEWWTMLEYPSFSLLNHWIYCELFHHDIDKACDPGSTPKTLGLKTRILYCRYLLPDCNDKMGKVPKHIWEQAYRYSSGPWDTSRNATRLGCYMMIWQILLTEGSRGQTNPLRRKSIAQALGDETLSPEASSLSYDELQVGAVPLGRRLLYNIVQHKPLLVYRLLLPGGRGATAAEIEALAQLCNQPEAVQNLLEATRINDAEESDDEEDLITGDDEEDPISSDDEEDLISSDDEDAIATRITRWEGSVRLDPPREEEERIPGWRWTGIERDIHEIIWRY